MRKGKAGKRGFPYGDFSVWLYRQLILGMIFFLGFLSKSRESRARQQGTDFFLKLMIVFSLNVLIKSALASCDRVELPSICEFVWFGGQVQWFLVGFMVCFCVFESIIVLPQYFLVFLLLFLHHIVTVCLKWLFV